MPFQFARPLWPLALAFFACAVGAQTPKVSQPPEVTPILTQPLHYRSLISRYESYSDQDVQAWREANDRVQRIGGWRTYAKEARETNDRTGQPPVSRAPGLEGHPHTHGGAQP